MINKNVYSVAEIQAILSISRNSAYKLIDNAPFPVIRLGRTIRIPMAPFDDWLVGKDLEGQMWDMQA